MGVEEMDYGAAISMELAEMVDLDLSIVELPYKMLLVRGTLGK
jgi:hypothetical protein